MKIISTVAEWQIEEFIVVLKRNKIKKGSDDWIKHLVMFGEARANAINNLGINGVTFSHDKFIIEYKNYWRLK